MFNLTSLDEEGILKHLSCFAESVAQVVSDLCGISFVPGPAPQKSSSQEITFNELTVFTSFTGTVQGNYILNIPKTAAAAVLGIDETSDNLDLYATGLFEEVLNVAVGESIEELKHFYGFLTFNSPIASLGQLRFPNYRSCGIALTSEIGEIYVNFAINMANLEITDKLLKTLKNLRKQQSLSYKDALTGIYNRAYFEYFKSKLFGKKRPLSMIIFDVDKFKDINDSFGHTCGDAALKHIADQMLANVRDTDIPIRFGGDEFLILLEESPLVGAERLIERVMSSLASKPLKTPAGKEIYITISAGVTEYELGESFEDLFGRADANLYKAKVGGRNQFCRE